MNTYWRWLLLAAAGVTGGIILAQTIPARAQDHERWWPRKGCEWRGDCKRYYGHRHRAPSRVYSYEHRLPVEARCKEPLTAVGEERYGSERAKEAATSIWMERVRFLHGIRYMDPKNARNLTYECGRSSTGNRASEKTAEVTGRYLEQCEVRGQPCRAEKEEGR